MAEPLTDARRAMWTAIRAWSDTRRAFKREFDFEKESAGVYDIAPAISDFPCLAIFPGGFDPAWWTNRMQEWSYSLVATIWVADWYLPTAESLSRKVIDAIFQAKAVDPGPSYVEAALNGKLPRISPIRIERTRIGEAEKTKAIRADITFVLPITYDPLGRV